MSSAPMLGQMHVPASADAARMTVEVEPNAGRLAPDPVTECLLQRIAEAYRCYHQVDSTRTQARDGQRRLRLVGRFGTELEPRGRYVSIDLEDFQ
jgi:hypothetical protein